MNGAELEADALREEIGRTRAELGQTLQELAARADLPSRARASAANAKVKVRATAFTPIPWVMLAGSVLAAVVTVVLATRSKSNRRGARWRRR